MILFKYAPANTTLINTFENMWIYLFRVPIEILLEKLLPSFGVEEERAH